MSAGHSSVSLRRSILCALFGALLFLPFASRAEAPVAPLRVLIVGGGPEKEYNQVAIESNVRYVCRLLPPNTARTILFADGNQDSATVLYDEEAKALSPGEQILTLLLRGPNALDDNPSHYRKPNLGALDGPSRPDAIEKAFAQLSQEADADPKRAHLLYFTGHGSSNQQDRENNHYDLWGKRQALSVRELAAHIARLPKETPITVVMVQCYSGAFGNLLFEGGDPKGEPADRDIAGFFATIKERVAAGCTSEVNEAEYHDFTSYFFAALTGIDRVGRKVTGVDYNRDGRVGMDEAFYYTIANDRSIDVPVSTSDVFLRRFVPWQPAEAFRTNYNRVRSWATPAQSAALETLSEKLKLRGEDRLSSAYQQMVHGDGGEEWGRDRGARRQMRQFESLRQERRRSLFRRWPDLQRSDGNTNLTLKREVITQLNKEAEAGRWDDLMQALSAVNRVEIESENRAIQESYLIRFVRLGYSILLAHRLQERGSDALKSRFERLVANESRSLLPRLDRLDMTRADDLQKR